MAVIFNMVEIMATLTDSLIAIFLLNRFFDKNKKHKFIYTIFMIAGMAVITDSLSNYYTLQWITSILCVFVYALIFYKGKWYTKIIVAIMFDIIQAVINGFGIGFISFITEMPLMQLVQPGTMERVMLLILVKVINFIAVYMFTMFFSKKRNIHMDIIQILVLFFSAVLASEMCKMIGASTAGKKTQIEYIVMIIIIGILNVTVFIVMRELESKHVRESQERYLEGRIEEENKLIDEIRNSHEVISVIRHDTKHYYSLLKVYLEQGKYEQAKELVATVVDEIDQGKAVVYCDNFTINSILLSKKEICERKSIGLDVMVMGTIPENVNDKFGIMLMNLLDNAIEAEEKEENKKIEVNIVVGEDKCDVTIKNTICKSVLNSNKDFVTTKEDKNNHGYGLKSIKHMAEATGGTLDVYEEDGKFIARVDYFTK